jgi:apolipoprotein N-acyltransferase
VVLEVIFVLAFGALVGASTYIWWLWPLVPVAIAALLYLVSRSSKMGAACLGWAFGAGLMGTAFSWGFDTLPLDWLGIPDVTTSFAIMVFVWGVCSILIALPVAAWTYCMRFISDNDLLLLVAAPLLWVIGEFVRAFIHVLITWGSGSVLNANFSFGFVGYALSWSDYLWVARFGGVIPLSLVVVFIGTVVFVVWRRSVSVQERIGFCAALLLVFVCIGVLPLDPVQAVFNPPFVEVEGVRVVPITTQAPPVLSRPRAELARLEEDLVVKITDALKEKPDIIVLPEYQHFLKSEHLLSQDSSLELRRALSENNVLVVDSERTKNDLSGAIKFFDGKEVVAEHGKKLLIPLGEFLPYSLIFIFQHIGMRSEVDEILKYRTYVPSGDSFAERLVEWRGRKLAVLACSEVFNPFGYKQASDAGADILINIASHSWARGRSNTLFNEALAMARVHAVYTGKVFIQATNYNPSFVLYPSVR